MWCVTLFVLNPSGSCQQNASQDTNGDGVISRSEFAAATSAPAVTIITSREFREVVFEDVGFEHNYS